MKGPRSAVGVLAVVILFAAGILVGCGPSDPRKELLDERARWKVDVRSWAAGDDGRLLVSTRVTGPPNSALRQLTVRIDLLDADGGTLREVWETYDLTQIPRGGPKDIALRVPADGLAVEGIAVQRVLSPTAEQESHIVEMQGLSDG